MHWFVDRGGDGKGPGKINKKTTTKQKTIKSLNFILLAHATLPATLFAMGFLGMSHIILLAMSHEIG